MIQEDSNGESSFEIIDKRNRESPNNSDNRNVSETASSISSPYSIPSPSVINLPGGNLLSNVAPPSSIPDFSLLPSSPASLATSPSISPNVNLVPPITSQATLPKSQPLPPTAGINPLARIGEQFPATQFSAAIPPNKGIPLGPNSQSNQPESSSGFLGMVKEAFSSGVLSKVAERAKHSVDSIITTLDPQMSEYIYSGGDIEITVTTEQEEEVSAIRESIHSVFGKAWVNGIKLNLPPKKSQAVGFKSGVKNALEKIDYSLKYRKTPTVAIENVLLQQNNDWYDLSLLVLKDNEKQITVQTFSQATPVPVDQFLRQMDKENPESRTLSNEEKLAIYVQSKPGWQQTVSGVTRKEVLSLAGTTLISMYKNQLSSK